VGRPRPVAVAQGSERGRDVGVETASARILHRWRVEVLSGSRGDACPNAAASLPPSC
jgi:hypothetical protein